MISLLLGEGAWNPGNFGFALAPTGEYELRKIDFGLAFTFSNVPLPDALTVEGLLKALKVRAYFTDKAVDPREIDETIAELKTNGKERIASVIAEFDPAFAEFGKSGYQKEILVELLTRVDKLCASWKPLA